MKKLKELANFMSAKVEQLKAIQSAPIIDFSKVDSIEFDGYDPSDYPDFSDVFISACDYQGRPATEQELDAINAEGDFVHEQFLNSIF